MHKLVLETASQAKISVCVPQWPHFVKNDDSWWNMNLPSFPTRYTTCNVLCSERIPPLPQEVRERLIDLYCPLASITTIKANDADRDCSAEDLELPIMKYAHAMAETLAMMHWTAKTDTHDISYWEGFEREQETPITNTLTASWELIRYGSWTLTAASR
ncbi:uncharacterized protein Z519_11517 [Cladophialophora bantiana CBS 173.52]|uniref:Uncharacterized protein n=1 Tax=Cladophialophora bantiana (strain ATCC 10958 / CBS 173.52 / CDC B-1940 / NIH 8579) TaxID=1442370 RepID=A0A0D2FMK3_CLAB1|nr:uncharacterized protein Z519_11517 [Cladophialophora bantiana CBS 173.52]KIW87932.1 hypothetical protein Z519_11517 [Cladophialophora bantiana CBS 173.52]